MQRAALELARGATCEDVGRLLGVTGESVRQWTKRSDWGQYAAVARELAQGEAVASVRNNIVPIRPGVTVEAPTEGSTPEDLVAHALQVVKIALTEGDVRAATWVLERVDPERFGTPKDRQVMAELRKAAATSKGGPVRVTIAAPKRREQSA
jgi:hypothetical protein